MREHVRSHAENHGWESLQVAALEREIPRLIDAGVMVSIAGVRDRMLASGGAPVPSPTIEAIGFPTSMFTAIFAVSRTVGWIAQWKEMIGDPQKKIGRPRQLYNGATTRDYVDIAKR